MHKIVFQTGFDRLRINFTLPLRFIDSHKLLLLSGVLAKAIIGDSIEPCREPRFATEAADVLVGPDERFLGQIICEGEIIPGELAQQTADARLMTTNQLAKSVLVVINKNSSDKVGIG